MIAPLRVLCNPPGVPVYRTRSNATIGGREPVLERNFGDDLLPPVSGIEYLEWGVDVSPPDTARSEDLVQPLYDVRTVRGSLRHLVEVNSKPRLVSELSASGGNGALMATS